MGTSKNTLSQWANLCTQVLALIAAYYLRPFSRAPQGIKEKAGMRGYKMAFFYFFPSPKPSPFGEGFSLCIKDVCID